MLRNSLGTNVVSRKIQPFSAFGLKSSRTRGNVLLASDIAEGFNQGALTPGGSVQVEICTALWLKA